MCVGGVGVAQCGDWTLGCEVLRHPEGEIRKQIGTVQIWEISPEAGTGELSSHGVPSLSIFSSVKSIKHPDPTYLLIK